MADIIFKEKSYKIIGACKQVRKKLGYGFLESVYSEALVVEFRNANIPYIKKKKFPVYYEDKPLNKYFRADFVCL